ncbi:Na+/H+ antiporter NhaC family protein [Virgibacillus alimentarius]|uniref:Na+/H+ antiporter NhaC n=1 Tax=Virgibacillus alimentarius TaxID=698769 RepID=A0ABS4SCC1_9BACI|nr:Na+/H+ antiporter NhaC family protein [Virgibacillus alimentarius]MBP2258544.1 Na+/H+ antiporter NhaC [Virgibacillus alimentarius]
MNSSSIKKGNALALLPFFIFLILFIGSGVINGDFYELPVLVAVFIAVLVALFMNRKMTFKDKLDHLTKGAGHPNIMLMVIIYLLAGAFASVAEGVGAVESTVNLGLTFLPENLLIVGLFVIGCFISISMGSSVGTVVALAPIGVGLAEQTGISTALFMGAIISGAMFGDNLSMISDTTIAAVRTQAVKMSDKFKVNIFIALPTAIVAAVIFGVLTWNASGSIGGDHPYDLIKVLPYLAVLIFAVVGVNVIYVLIGGTIFVGLVGFFYGTFDGMEFLNLLGEGMAGMQELSLLSILLGGLVELIRVNGGIAFLLNAINSRIKSRKGAEAGIAGLVSAFDLSTANNTISIISVGPLVKQITERFGVDPRRSASILDIFASAFQGVLPYGAQLLAVAGIASISPVSIMPYCIYPVLLAVAGMIAIATGFPKFTTEKTSQPQSTQKRK